MHIPPPVIMLGFIGLLYIFKAIFPGLQISVDGQQFIGLIIAFVALLMMGVAAWQFRTARTTILPNKLDQMSCLVTTGIFRLSRNPMYLGMALIIVGAGAYLGSVILPVVVYGFVLVINYIQIKPEEQALERIFGAEYVSYKAQTRRWI